MRIASLVPSATEMLFELGLGDKVVAVTHECDWPPRATSLPSLTRSVIPEGLCAREIDRAVRDRVASSAPLYELDRPLLEELAPDLIVTQAICEVCAVSYDDVIAVAATLPSAPRVLSLDPLGLEDVLSDLSKLGEAAGATQEAGAAVADARRRIEGVSTLVPTGPKPRVLALEWLDPPFVAGHWVPEMIGLAGGADALGRPRQRSRTASWEELRDAGSDLVLIMPCGYDTRRSFEEAQAHEDQIESLAAGRAVAVNASAYFSRPGPRLVAGIELLASLLHPDRFPAPAPDMAHEIPINSANAGGGTRTPTG